MKNDMPIEQLREMLSYDPETGNIFWTGIRPRQEKGQRALSSISKLGHYVGSILDRQFKASRVAWALFYGEWPESTLRHINGDNLDNRIGNLSCTRITSTALDRFASYVGPKLPSGCMEWQGGLGRGGYGKFRVRGGTDGNTSAHRFAYEMAKGDIPEGMFVCHSCDNRKCCNPDHLWLGTANDNVQDMVRKGRHIKLRTHCNHGHALTADNRKKLHGRLTYICRACGTATRLRSVARKKAAKADVGCEHSLSASAHSIRMMR